METMSCNSLGHRAFFFLHRWLSLSLILEACAFLWKTSASGYGFAIEELFPFAIFMPWLGVRFLFSYGTDGTPERRRSWFPWFLLLYGVFLAGSWYLDIHIFYLMRHQLWGLGLFVGKIAIVCFFCCDASSLPPRFLFSAWRAAYLPFGASRHLVWFTAVPAVSRIFNHGPVGFAPCILRRIWAVSLRFLGCNVFIPQVNMF